VEDKSIELAHILLAQALPGPTFERLRNKVCQKARMFCVLYVARYLTSTLICSAWDWQNDFSQSPNFEATSNFVSTLLMHQFNASNMPHLRYKLEYRPLLAKNRFDRSARLSGSP
jgi:hypothetical protein